MKPDSTQPKMSWEDAVVWLRNQPGKTDLIKACYYDDPIDQAAIRFYESPEWQEIRKYLPANPGEALDVGSGRGIAAYALSRENWKVTALEPDTSSIVGAGAISELAEKTGSDIRIVSEWGEKLPFDNASFGLIHARQVLHHARDLKQFCRELFRVCKPGGTIIATREHVINQDTDLDVFLKSHPLHHLYGGENAYKVSEYVSALSEAGFVIKENLSHFESAINYFPATPQDVNRSVLRSFVGGRIAGLLPVKVPEFFVRYYSRHLMRTPGRLYTFVAVKP